MWPSHTSGTGSGQVCGRERERQTCGQAGSACLRAASPKRSTHSPPLIAWPRFPPPPAQLLFWSIRFHGAVFFSSLRFDVRRIWQPSSCGCQLGGGGGGADGAIHVRWTITGTPRVPGFDASILDGHSEYRVDRAGKIYEHIGTCPGEAFGGEGGCGLRRRGSCPLPSLTRPPFLSLAPLGPTL